VIVPSLLQANFDPLPLAELLVIGDQPAGNLCPFDGEPLAQARVDHLRDQVVYG
jgi:hypothetical protein